MSTCLRWPSVGPGSLCKINSAEFYVWPGLGDWIVHILVMTLKSTIIQIYKLSTASKSNAWVCPELIEQWSFGYPIT